MKKKYQTFKNQNLKIDIHQDNIIITHTIWATISIIIKRNKGILRAK